MKKRLHTIVLLMLLAVLTACSDDNDEMDELKMLEVDFELPEEADVDETIELEAIVTYGNEKVTDAEDMKFEYWKAGNKDDSTHIESDNHEDGTYTAEVSFDDDGVYEMFAHTTAEGMHTMPKKYLAVGDATEGDIEKVKQEEEDEKDSDNNE